MPEPLPVQHDKWDVRFMRLARDVASWSKDPDAKVGAVVVSPDRRRFTIGFNGLPRGLHDSEDRLHDKDLKNALSVHAELNAILNAGTALDGWTLYVTKPPCRPCALAIIQARIARVVRPKIQLGVSRWTPEQVVAQALLKEAGVESCTLDLP